MGSCAECWLDSFYVGSTKDDIDPGLMQLFRAADRVTVQATKHTLPFQMHRYGKTVDDDEDITVTYYHAPLPVVRDRLELKGYMLEVARAGISMSLNALAAHYTELAMGSHREIFEPLAKVFESADVDKWFAALSEIRRNGLTQRIWGGETTAYQGTLIGYMLENDWYGYSGPDLNIGLRLALEVCPDTAELIYDVTDLILSECFAPADDLVEYALAVSSSHFSSQGKIIVLTEGRSDSRIIADSLQLLYPHLADYFTFMDFEGARWGGGAGNLANIVKAFAGAGIVNRVVALFDNDTAAEIALRPLRAVRLPRSIAVQRLPELPALRRYPTIGPSGLVAMDVNGIAASIELYLGADILSDGSSNLTPVQWTGYEPSLRKYQGEVMSKDRIQERFARRLDACRKEPDLVSKTDWSGIRAILTKLLAAFRTIDGEDICSFLECYHVR